MNVCTSMLGLLFYNTVAVSYHCKAYDDLHNGPLNITRTVGETYVVIPCPYSGAYQVTWNINGHLYSMFNLPQFDGIKLLPISSGLLIPVVTEHLDGTTFQCFYPSGNGFDVLMSTMGSIRVVGERKLNSLQSFHVILLYILPGCSSWFSVQR